LEDLNHLGTVVARVTHECYRRMDKLTDSKSLLFNDALYCIASSKMLTESTHTHTQDVLLVY